MKRIFDIFFSTIGLTLLFPFILLFSLAIVITSGFPVFYSQNRIGKDEKDFNLLKFRTMKRGADTLGLLTVGEKDARITSFGYFLRKYKLDELPQLINVLTGDMSLVGPRPEVRKYVELYNADQKKVLSVKPGITDYASIVYSSENEILSNSSDPEQQYISKVMPAKLRLNMKYIQDQDIMTDLKIILKTIGRIVG